MTRTAAWATGALVLLVGLALAGPLFAPADPVAIGDVVGTRLLAPFATDAAGHWHMLGTDRFGRDLFFRMLVAGRVSLLVGVIGSVAAAALGLVIGALAGWRRGAFELVAMAAADTMLAVPRLVLLLVCAALWRPGTATVIVVLAATGWMGIARLVRGEVLGLVARPFVGAAAALGARPGRILWRHVVPNALGPLLVATTLGVGNAILLESGLSFLGLGVQPPAPSWGNMIAGGRDLIVVAPWVSLAPGIALVGTVLCCTLLGDALDAGLRGEAGAGLRELSARGA